MTNYTFRRVQHVSLTRPRGSEDAVRHFYGEVLGLTEISRPSTLSHLDLVWYSIGDDELHLVAEDDVDNTNSGRHFCVQVSDLQAVRDRLAASDVRIWDTTPIPGRPRFFCADPFENSIEITEFRPEEAE